MFLKPSRMSTIYEIFASEYDFYAPSNFFVLMYNCHSLLHNDNSHVGVSGHTCLNNEFGHET